VNGKRIRLAVVLIALWVTACNSHTEIPNEQEELIRHGQQLYVEYCAECHQPDGMGWSDLYPRLAGNPIVTLHDPEPIIVTVTYGQGSMMGFRDKLDSAQIAEILSYIRTAWGNNAAPVSSRQIH